MSSSNKDKNVVLEISVHNVKTSEPTCLAVHQLMIGSKLAVYLKKPHTGLYEESFQIECIEPFLLQTPEPMTVSVFRTMLLPHAYDEINSLSKPRNPEAVTKIEETVLRLFFGVPSVKAEIYVMGTFLSADITISAIPTILGFRYRSPNNTVVSAETNRPPRFSPKY